MTLHKTEPEPGRVVLRAEWPDADTALERLAEVRLLAELERPAGHRLLVLQLRTRPERGRRCYFECQWVSEQWWNAERVRRGRSLPRDEYERRKREGTL